jgi:hypothetical protein
MDFSVLTEMDGILILIICNSMLTSPHIQRCVGGLCSAELKNLGSMMPMSRPQNYHLVYLKSKKTQLCFHFSTAINHNRWETTEHCDCALSRRLWYKLAVYRTTLQNFWSQYSMYRHSSSVLLLDHWLGVEYRLRCSTDLQIPSWFLWLDSLHDC